jgi:hypothetical protein
MAEHPCNNSSLPSLSLNDFYYVYAASLVCFLVYGGIIISHKVFLFLFLMSFIQKQKYPVIAFACDKRLDGDTF